ncbi:MAG: T9SS type A sorting domain-containing protein [Cyclobacteriaceae bacterium]|nr:T9SS type A sorting domain-containing protein [Cyclobacteriaceae bacterium]
MNLQGKAGTYSNSDFSISGPSSLCPNGTGSYSSTYINNDITEYRWGWGTLIYQSGQGTPYLGVRASTSFSGGSVVLQLRNRCGLTGTPAVRSISRGSCGFRIAVSPNPVSTKLTIELTKENDGVDFDSKKQTTNLIEPIKVLIVNSHNEKVFSETMNSSQFTIDVSGIPNGVYYLKIGDNELTSSTRVLINH